MSISYKPLAVLLLTAMLVACNGSNHKEDSKITHPQQHINQDSLRQSNLVTVITERYPQALIWDSVYYDYTYAYQKALQDRPIIILTGYNVSDVWQVDSITYMLLISRNLPLTIDIQPKDSLLLKKIIPSIMASFPYGRTAQEKADYDSQLLELGEIELPSLVIRISKVSYIDQIRYILDYPLVKHSINGFSGIADFRGTLIDVIE